MSGRVSSGQLGSGQLSCCSTFSILNKILTLQGINSNIFFLRPREEPQNLQQTHYVNVLLKINFAQPIADPITQLAEAMQNSTNQEVFPVAESLSVLDASGKHDIDLPM